MLIMEILAFIGYMSPKGVVKLKKLSKMELDRKILRECCIHDTGTVLKIPCILDRKLLQKVSNEHSLFFFIAILTFSFLSQ